MKEINQIDEAVMFLDYLAEKLPLTVLRDLTERGYGECLHILQKDSWVGTWQELDPEEKQKVFEWYLKTVK